MTDKNTEIHGSIPRSELIAALGRVEVVRDDVAEKLDEMADLCEYWKRNRDRGYHPNAIRAALITLAEEVVALTGIKGAR